MPRCESLHLTSAPKPPADRTKRPLAVPDVDLPALGWPVNSEFASALAAWATQHSALTPFSTRLRTRPADRVQASQP